MEASMLDAGDVMKSAIFKRIAYPNDCNRIHEEDPITIIIIITEEAVMGTIGIRDEER